VAGEGGAASRRAVRRAGDGRARDRRPGRDEGARSPPSSGWESLAGPLVWVVRGRFF